MKDSYDLSIIIEKAFILLPNMTERIGAPYGRDPCKYRKTC